MFGTDCVHLTILKEKLKIEMKKRLGVASGEEGWTAISPRSEVGATGTPMGGPELRGLRDSLGASPCTKSNFGEVGFGPWIENSRAPQSAVENLQRSDRVRL